MAVTIKDVARELGVSISTVSRALNNGYGVNDRTREDVVAAAARLDYAPQFRRSRPCHRTHALPGPLAERHSKPLLRRGGSRRRRDAARAGGCDLVLCNSDLDSDKQMQYVSSLLEKRVDGIVINSVAVLTREQQAWLAARGVPIVLLNRSSLNRGFSTVCADNETGGVLAAEYLLRLGHRKIAHLTGPPEHGNSNDRTRAFKRTLHSANNPVQPIVLRGKVNFNGGCELTKRLLEEHPEVTAIFASNDVMAFGVVQAALDCGVRIPEDVSLIGFDNLEFSGIIHPPLTTIHQPKYEMGRAAVEILLRLAHNKDKQVLEHLTLGVELIERQSCRPLA